jgi:hypothetical protein
VESALKSPEPAIFAIQKEEFNFDKKLKVWRFGHNPHESASGPHANISLFTWEFYFEKCPIKKPARVLLSRTIIAQ